MFTSPRLILAHGRGIKKLGLGLDYQQFKEYSKEQIRYNKTGWKLINHGKDFKIH